MQSDFRYTTRFRIAIAGLAIVAAAAACGDDYDNGPSAPQFPAALGAAKDVSDGGTADLVIMDDYILSEPIKN